MRDIDYQQKKKYYLYIMQTNSDIKLYKNSECINGCFLVDVKIKEHPITKEKVIICKDCYTKLYLKNKEK